jgi:hypothetical protein
MSTKRAIICEPGILRSFNTINNRSNGLHGTDEQYAPSRVTVWEDFIQQVNQFPIADEPCQYANFYLPDRRSSYSNEAGLTFAFVSDFIARLTLFGVDLDLNVVGIDISLSKPPRQLIGEIKYFDEGWIDIFDLSERYNREMHDGSLQQFASKSIRQLYTYMRRNELQFSFLSIHEKTWFFRRSSEDVTVLEVSPMFWSSSRDPSISQCLWYLLNVPLCPQENIILPPIDEERYYSEVEIPTSDNFPSSQRRGYVPESSSSSSDNRYKKRKNNRRFKLEELYGFSSDQSWTGNILNGALNAAECTALKCADDAVHEVISAMESLKSLRPLYIPNLLNYGLIQGHPCVIFERFTLVDTSELTLNEKAKYLECLRQMQRLDYEIKDYRMVKSGGNFQLVFRNAYRHKLYEKRDKLRHAEDLRRLLFGKENISN